MALRVLALAISLWCRLAAPTHHLSCQESFLVPENAKGPSKPDALSGPPCGFSLHVLTRDLQGPCQHGAK